MTKFENLVISIIELIDGFEVSSVRSMTIDAINSIGKNNILLKFKDELDRDLISGRLSFSKTDMIFAFVCVEKKSYESVTVGVNIDFNTEKTVINFGNLDYEVENEAKDKINFEARRIKSMYVKYLEDKFCL